MLSQVNAEAEHARIDPARANPQRLAEAHRHADICVVRADGRQREESCSLFEEDPTYNLVLVGHVLSGASDARREVGTRLHEHTGLVIASAPWIGSGD